MTSGSDTTRPPIIVLAGPTASGKSALALDLAERIGGVIVNADSMQVYRDLRVITARPDPADEARVPHRLYGMVPAAEAYSAARWRDAAVAEIAAARAGGRVPILVGGTGLYLRVLHQGMVDLPPIDPAIRARLESLRDAAGQAELYRRLAAADPAGAARIKPADRQRTLRALEVFEATGRPLSAWQEEPGPQGGIGPIAWIWLDPPRAELHDRAARRFLAMLDQGALEEVRALLALDLDPTLPAMKALGVPELARHLRGEVGLEEAETRAVTATRQYIKRQTTWFRHQLPNDKLQIAQFSESLDFRILPFIRRFGLTTP